MKSFESKAISDDESLSPVSPGPMFIHESRCTKWAKEPLIQVQFEKNYKDRLEIRLEEADKNLCQAVEGAKMRLKESQRMIEEADSNFRQALERAERRASELVAWAERTLSEAVQRGEEVERRASELAAWVERTLSEPVQRLGANKRQEEVCKILSQAMERIERIRKEGQDMEEAQLFELNDERIERRASELIAASLKEAQEEVARSVRDSRAKGQLVQIHKP